MNIKKCKTCVHYDSFFGACGLYFAEIYLDEGNFDLRPISIKNISKSECNYIAKDN